MDIILFGMQGSGKGTLGKALAEKFNMEIFETGAELRHLSSQDTPLGQKIKSIIDAGHLVPNEIVMEIVENFIIQLPKSKGVLFDGIPRKIEQAHTLNDLLDKHNRNFIAVLLEVSEETAKKRLAGRRVIINGQSTTRDDDKPEIIQKRIEVFHKETLPTIELYKQKIIVIDGEPMIEEVQENAIKILSAKI